VDTRGCARGRRIDLHSNTRHHAVERVDFSARVPFALSILEFRKKRKKKPQILVRVFIGTFSFFGFFALFFGRAFSLGVPRDLSVRDSLRGRNEGSPLLLFLYIS